MLWCMEWVTVLDAALVVRASKRQELSWIWGKEEGGGGGGGRRRESGEEDKGNGEDEDEREEEKEDV